MKLKLSNGKEIPKTGFGTWQLKGDDAYNGTISALKAGYRHIDTATAYGNEKEIGKAIKDSKIPREEIFITTKLWNTDQLNNNTENAIKKSLEDLCTDYIDLYLIHWPKGYDNIIKAWSVMEKYSKLGILKSIGVSNFKIHHLENLFANSTMKPVVNQVECNLTVMNTKLHEFLNTHKIIMEAYAPLGSKNVKDFLMNATLTKISTKYDVNPSQMALKYLIQSNIIPIPRSSNEERIKLNYNLFDFEITMEDMSILSTINREEKVFPDPDNIDF